MATPETQGSVQTEESAPSACKDCGEGYVWSGNPVGEEVTVASLPTYHAAPVSTPEREAAILFIHDAFGWKFLNNRLLCDRLATATGFHVYMPDFYGGETLVTEEQAKSMIDPQPTWFANIVAGFRIIASAPSILMSLSKFSLARTQPLLDLVVAELVAMHGGEKCKLGAVGYCWGGKYCLRLGAQKKAAAIVACHPSSVKPQEDNLKQMSAACLFIRAEKDFVFPESLWNETETAIREAGATVDSALYAGTKHGFAVRCDEVDSVACEARNDALKKTADWFKLHLA